MKNPDKQNFHSLPEHTLNIQPSADDQVSPLQYLVPKWGYKSIDLSKHGVVRTETTRVIYPSSDKHFNYYNTLVVFPLPGCRQEYSLQEVDRIKKRGSALTIYKKTEEGNNQQPIHFSVARFWMRDRV